MEGKAKQLAEGLPDVVLFRKDGVIDIGAPLWQLSNPRFSFIQLF